MGFANPAGPFGIPYLFHHDKPIIEFCVLLHKLGITCSYEFLASNKSSEYAKNRDADSNLYSKNIPT